MEEEFRWKEISMFANEFPPHGGWFFTVEMVICDERSPPTRRCSFSLAIFTISNDLGLGAFQGQDVASKRTCQPERCIPLQQTPSHGYLDLTVDYFRASWSRSRSRFVHTSLHILHDPFLVGQDLRRGPFRSFPMEHLPHHSDEPLSTLAL